MFLIFKIIFFLHIYISIIKLNLLFNKSYFYFLALNGDNITANRYIYVGLNGVVEALAYVSTVPLLLYVGRKTAVSGLLFASGILQLSLVVIPQGKQYNTIL